MFCAIGTLVHIAHQRRIRGGDCGAGYAVKFVVAITRMGEHCICLGVSVVYLDFDHVC